MRMRRSFRRRRCDLLTTTRSSKQRMNLNKSLWREKNQISSTTTGSVVSHVISLIFRSSCETVSLNCSLIWQCTRCVMGTGCWVGGWCAVGNGLDDIRSFGEEKIYIHIRMYDKAYYYLMIATHVRSTTWRSYVTNSKCSWFNYWIRTIRSKTIYIKVKHITFITKEISWKYVSPLCAFPAHRECSQPLCNLKAMKPASGLRVQPVSPASQLLLIQ